eukprot:TRINITY_DN5385_c0_g1_i2.p1 TRINITY_DN5385_c0_g1~~TRINITY_DN5385_c0_g1_i2.p1  ORF type:complete len:230 (+),score=92.01 TRINITY_DN5385_c0_g1_i2:160-849(+)
MDLKSVTIAAAVVGFAGLAIYLTPKSNPIKKKAEKIALAGPFEGEDEQDLEGIDPLSKLKERTKAPRAPPSGFKWYYNSLVKVFALIPDGWEVDDKKEGNPCFDAIPKERKQVGTYPRFSLFGMMVDKKKGITIENFAQGLSTSLEQTGRKIETNWKNSSIPTEREIIYITKDLIYTSSETTCLTELIYNPLTETIYVVQFEGPTTQWNELFLTFGSTMIGSVEPSLER